MTSSTKQRDPEDIRVRLSFDVDQITQSLVYEFYSITKKKPMRIKKYGRVAGSYNFVENDKLYIEIEAYNTTPKTPVRNLNLNCTFVFTGMPNSAGSDQALSPFDKDIASFTFADGEWDN
ncbi:MAG: hypothetical protein EX271_08720, partial [Acidimicrobiales bacterium]